MPKPKIPTAREKEAAFLVARADPEYIQSCLSEKDKKAKAGPKIPDSETLRRKLKAHPQGLPTNKPNVLNLGPNPPGHVPQPFGLLDFQDIALFLWPPYRQHSGFDLDDQCLIMKHRNPRLQEITEEDMVEIQEWMDTSQIITVEGNSVDIRKWRQWLCEKELESLSLRMEQDLKQARSMLYYQWRADGGGSNRKRKLAAMRRLHDEEDDY